MKNELHSVDMRPTPKPRQHVKENHQRKYGPLELYKPPHERHSNGTVANGTENVFKAPHSNEGYRNPPNDTKPKEVHSSPTTESWIESRKVPQTKIEKLPKLADLPPKSITSGMVADVYISHCNSPLSFYVQLVKEEDNIFLIADKLNDRSCLSVLSLKTRVHKSQTVGVLELCMRTKLNPKERFVLFLGKKIVQTLSLC